MTTDATIATHDDHQVPGEAALTVDLADRSLGVGMAISVVRGHAHVRRRPGVRLAGVRIEAVHQEHRTSQQRQG